MCSSGHAAGVLLASDAPRRPPPPRPQLCVLGDHKHCEEAKALGLDAMTVDDLKKLNKNKKLVKKLGEWWAAGAGAAGKGCGVQITAAPQVPACCACNLPAPVPPGPAACPHPPRTRPPSVLRSQEVRRLHGL